MAEGIVPFKDLAKQQLLERCRELEFVDDVQDLRCTRCNRLTLEHWYTNCGHTLCPNCKRLLSGGRCRCPHCGQFILHIEEQSADFEAKVNGLRAKCPNSKYGCPLVTTVKQLQEHLVGCRLIKEQVLPAVYRGTNTVEILLEEMGNLKEQMGEMSGTIGFLLNELHKRQEVEEEIKNNLEMSVEDIKIRLNGLSSDLHYETSTLKLQIKDIDQIHLKELLGLKDTLTLDINNKINTMEKATKEINLEKLSDHFVSKEEMNGSNKLLIQMLEQKDDRFRQKLTEEVEAMDVKIVTSEGKMEAALTKNRQEIAATSKDIQGIVEKSCEELKTQLQKLSSDLNEKLKQQETSFNQILSNEVKLLDEKMSKNKTTVVMNGKEIHAKMEAIKRQMAANVKNMQEKLKESIEKLKQQLVEVKSDVTRGFKEEQLCCNQKLTEEFKVLEDKMRCKEDEIDKKIGFGFEKQEVAVENCRKEMAAFNEEIESKIQLGQQEVERLVKGSVEIATEEINNQFEQLSSQMSCNIEKETKQMNEEIDQLKKKTSEIEKNIDGTTKSLQVDYKTKVEAIKQMNPRLKQIEAFQRGVAIEQLLNRKSSVCQLVDSFLFGSAQEQITFDYLCFKWTIKHFDQFIPKGGRREHLSDVFLVYGHLLKAQIKLTTYSDGDIYFELCFNDEKRKGQEVDIKPLPMVNFIIKDLSGHSQHCIKYYPYPFNSSLQYNQFGPWSYYIHKLHWSALISSRDKLMEVLVLVEPPTIINKPLSVDGTLMDTIEHYSRKLQMAKEGLIEGHWSPSFLTKEGGFRVAVEMRLNESIGINERGLAAVVCILSGEFDSQLGSEFVYVKSVTLINQLDANKNITVERQFSPLTIASNDEIDSEGFLLNDSLTYHVTIQYKRI